MSRFNIKGTTRVESIDALRGIAALAVCCFHFVGTNADLPETGVIGALKLVTRFGEYGVEVFFVISGFIIPYSLRRSGYQLRNYPTFIVKRLIRLDPPYLVSVILCLLLVVYATKFSPSASGQVDARLNPLGILLHLGYLNVLFGYPWLNVVYWTLAIELQYYLLVGLAFPLINSDKQIARYAFFVAMLIACWFIKAPSFIFHFIPFFLMGMSIFHYRSGMTGKLELSLHIIGLTIAAGVATGLTMTVAGLFAVGIIIFTRLSGSVFLFLGTISYSLYLLHTPIGGSILSMSRRFGSSATAKMFAVGVALAASIGAAYLLFRFVEKPAQRWSSSFTYGPQVVAKVPPAMASTETV